VKLFYTACAALVALTSCKQEPKVQATASGIRYEYLTKRADGAEKQMAKTGDFLTFHGTYRAHVKDKKDTLLGSSHMSGQPISFEVQPMMNGVKDFFYDCYTLLAKGDSARFFIPTDSIFKGAMAMQRPPTLPPGSDLLFEVRVENVETKDAMSARKNNEVEGFAKKSGLTYTTLPTGVRVAVLAPGAGPIAKNGDTVYVHYRGYLPGTPDTDFDNSRKSPESKPLPLVLGAHNVISGWEDGLATLPQGAKATFIIPSDRGYGAQGAPPVIPANATLCFDVEVVKIVAPKVGS
jgi:FKBP-type peptidyl-prolyl cis-trans isomerase FkpA